MFSMLNEWWMWYRNSGLDQVMLSVPLVETMVLFITLTICLFFRFSRTGLILAYLFFYRLGWTVQIREYAADPDLQTAFSAGYLIFGILVFTFLIISTIIGGYRDK